LIQRDKLALDWCSFYRGLVEVFADSRPPSISRDGALARVTLAVMPQLEEVEARIAREASSFDPAIEGYVTYAIGSRGKRLRPLMALLSGGATGEITSGHLDLAVIVELIHIATLVHDDIMDEAERRRAQPTVNARWGNSLSVLLGDCLFAQALNLSTNFDNAEISRVIARAAREVCSGEIIQTQRRFDLHLAIEDYLRIVEMKTGSLFAAAAELGARLNGADGEATAALKNFGRKIGAAYQIYDDCLDIAGNETEIGKTLGTDLRKGKMTLPILMLLQSAPPEERERYCELILSDEAGAIATLLKSDSPNGALRASLEAGDESVRDAQAELHALPPNPFTDSLFQLGDALREMLDQIRV
jgi:octaprenyl-diphosphate synthase